MRDATAVVAGLLARAQPSALLVIDRIGFRVVRVLHPLRQSVQVVSRTLEFQVAEHPNELDKMKHIVVWRTARSRPYP